METQKRHYLTPLLEVCTLLQVEPVLTGSTTVDPLKPEDDYDED